MRQFIVCVFVAALLLASVRAHSARVQDLLKRMTIEEKVGQMTQLNIDMVTETLNPIKVDKEKVRNYARNYFVGSFLNSPTANFGEALNASEWVQIITDIQSVYVEEGITPMIYGLDSVHGANYIGNAVIFPQQINAGASFNPSLVEKMGAVTAKDTRAVGIHWTFAPILDIATHPAWPRVFETFGEDPKLASVMGSAIIKGFQGYPAQLNDPTKLAACMKHFIGYGNPRTGQDRTTSVIPDRQLRQYYLPSFQAAVDTGVATCMESYNDINGEPVIASEKYLKKILREEMGFKGMLVTDWREILDLQSFHRITPTTMEATRIVMDRTSVDMSMVPQEISFFNDLVALVRNGIIPEARLDESVARILQLKEDVGLLDSPVPDPNSPWLKTIGQAEDRAAALELARESIVLTENRNGFLPLNAATLQRVFLVGPSSASITNQCGGWTIHWQGAPSDDMFQYGTTVLEGIQNVLASQNPNVELLHQTGFSISGQYTQDDLNAALANAMSSDVVIVAFGESHYAEALGNIRQLSLPQGQLDFVQQLINTGKPVVLVLLEGRPRLLGGVSDGARAVLDAFLPGPDGGQAIADVLFGLVNPSGKMPISYPRNDADGPLQYYRTVTSEGDYLWEFGHGLSYSSFSYSNLRLSNNSISDPNGAIDVTVTVQNEGSLPGKETVLFFLKDEYREVTPEVKLLFSFEKVELARGESREVTTRITTQDLAFYGLDDSVRVLEQGDYQLLVGPIASPLSAKFTLLV